MNKAFIFDFDDTLANTACHVIVRNSVNMPCRSLTPAKFNTYQLEYGESFDFSEFRDAIFIHKAEPTFLIHLAKEVHDEGHPIFILTAREPDVSASIYAWLCSHGIQAHEIHCVGGSKETIPANKKEVMLDIVKRYDKCYFYDDSQENVDIYQHEKLRSYLV